MQFDYDQYVRVCCQQPIFALIVCIAALIGLVIKLISLISSREKDYGEYVPVLFMMCIPIYLLCMQVGILFNGGFHLLYEKSSAAVTLQGELQDVEFIDEKTFPNLGYIYGNDDSAGVRLTIDGVECIAPAIGEFQVGYQVEILYLPNSRYVLSMEPFPTQKATASIDGTGGKSLRHHPCRSPFDLQCSRHLRETKKESSRSLTLLCVCIPYFAARAIYRHGAGTVRWTVPAICVKRKKSQAVA